jgi:uncharacterized protein
MWAIDCDQGPKLRDRKSRMAVFATMLLASVVMLQAQNPQSGGSPSLRVHGQATLSVEPEQAQFDIGVVTQAPTAKAATEQNDNRSNVLVHELTSAFPSAGIKSINFSVNPNYTYPPEGAPTIAGYTAGNTVRILLDDISKLQTVIDIAIKSGANSINRLSFTVRNEDLVRAQALARAAHQAQISAEALASSLHLKLGKLLTVEEGQPVIISPPRQITFEKLQSTNLAPISPGTIDVHADVDLVYEVTPAAEQHPARLPTTPRSPVNK